MDDKKLIGLIVNAHRIGIHDEIHCKNTEKLEKYAVLDDVIAIVWVQGDRTDLCLYSYMNSMHMAEIMARCNLILDPQDLNNE